MDEFSSNIDVMKSFLTVAQNPDVVKGKIDTSCYIKLILHEHCWHGKQIDPQKTLP